MTRARRRTADLARALAVALLATGCATARNYVDTDGPLYEGHHALPRGPVAGAARLRVVTFNIEHGRKLEQALRALRDHRNLAGADVLLLQEMDAPGVAAIARALALNYVYYPASHHTKLDRDLGNAVLTPWPIEGRWKLVLPHRSRFSGHARAAVGVLARVAGRRVRVYSLHLGTPLNLSAKQRHEQLQAIVADARDSPDPVLVGGDFNGKAMAAYLAARGFCWPTREVGKTSTLFSSSFDHVLARGLEPAEAPAAGVARDVVGVSDHFPVWAAFEAGVLEPDAAGRAAR